MIHVGVSKEEICVQQISLIEHDMLAQQTDSCARIHNDTLLSASDLKAGGITPVPYSTWTGTGNTAPRTPKFEAKISGIRHRKLRSEYS